MKWFPWYCLWGLLASAVIGGCLGYLFGWTGSILAFFVGALLGVLAAQLDLDRWEKLE